MVCSAERNSRSTCAYTNSVLKNLNGGSFPEDRSLEMTTSDTTLYNNKNKIEQGNYSNYIPMTSVGEHRRAHSEKNAFFEVGDRAARYCGGFDSARSSWGLPSKGVSPSGRGGRSLQGPSCPSFRYTPGSLNCGDPFLPWFCTTTRRRGEVPALTGPSPRG